MPREVNQRQPGAPGLSLRFRQGSSRTQTKNYDYSLVSMVLVREMIHALMGNPVPSQEPTVTAKH